MCSSVGSCSKEAFNGHFLTLLKMDSQPLALYCTVLTEHLGGGAKMLSNLKKPIVSHLQPPISITLHPAIGLPCTKLLVMCFSISIGR